MTTKTMTAPQVPPLLGPKIKTALPGPNAKRVLGERPEIYFTVVYPLLSAGGQEWPRHRRH